MYRYTYTATHDAKALKTAPAERSAGLLRTPGGCQEVPATKKPIAKKSAAKKPAVAKKKWTGLGQG